MENYMLIELLKPRRFNTPVTMPDGSSVQFNEDGVGRLTAEVPNDQAILILKHKDIFAAIKVAPPKPVEVEPESNDTDADALEGILKPRVNRRTKKQDE